MKRFLASAILLISALMAAPVAQAQGTYPVRPVKIICGFPPGTTLDIVTRIYAKELEESLGQPFVVVNRTGASGNVAAEMVAHATPDGYTLVTGGITQAISMSLFKKINYNVVKDLEPIGFMSVSPLVLVVKASLGVKSVPQLIALAKAHPGELTYGTAGVGTAPHMAGEQFNYMTGVKMVPVHYRGSNHAILDLMAGRLSMMFAPVPTAVPHLKDKRLTFLALASGKHSNLIPNLPLLAEMPGLAGFDASLWQGMWAPKGTPKEIVKAIHAVLVKAAAKPDVQKKLANISTDYVIATSDEFGTYVSDEVKKWAKIVEFSGAKVE